MVADVNILNNFDVTLNNAKKIFIRILMNIADNMITIYTLLISDDLIIIGISGISGFSIDDDILNFLDEVSHFGFFNLLKSERNESAKQIIKRLTS